MSTVFAERRRTSRTPAKDSQRLQNTGNSIRSSTIEKGTLGQDPNRLSLSRTRLANATVENDYIKQLQEQIYYLETEGLYLREQLNKRSTTLERALSNERLNSLDRDRYDLQRSLIKTSSQFDQVASEKHGLQVALEELRLKFDREKQNLLDELESLRRVRETLDHEKLERDQELRQIRERNKLSAEELRTAESKIRVLEQQLERQLGEYRAVTDELQNSKLENTSLQRSLSNYQLVSRERDRLQGLVAELENELEKLRGEVKSQDSRYNEVQLLRSRLVEEKTALMKEIARLETLNKDFQRELDQIRLLVRERNEQVNSKDKEIMALRKKEQNYLAAIESLQIRIDGEATKNHDLEGQIKHLQRQLNAEMQTTLTIKRDFNEVSLKNDRLVEQSRILEREKEDILTRLSESQSRLKNEESLNTSLRFEIQDLEDRVKEIDRLKNLEDLIQAQRWEDITQMAQTMQSLGRTMARATSPTTLRRRIENS